MLPLPRVGGPPGELRERVQRPNVCRVAAQHPLDLPARVGLPPRQLVHFGERQADIAVGRIERRGPTELGFGLAVAAASQVNEPEVGVAERLVRGQRHDLAELRFGLGQLVLLQVGQAPGAGGEGGVALRHLVLGWRGSPASHHEQSDYAQVFRAHACSSNPSAPSAR